MKLLNVNSHFINLAAGVYTTCEYQLYYAVPLVLQFVWHFTSFKSQFIQFTTDSQLQIVLNLFPFRQMLCSLARYKLRSNEIATCYIEMTLLSWHCTCMLLHLLPLT